MLVVVRAVAFFRNLNLGQHGSPTRDQLLAAMERAGAREAASFQVNGTVVLTAEDPQLVVEDAVSRLTGECGYADLAIVRPLDWLAGLGLEEVTGNAEVTLFDAPADFPEPLPWVPERGDVTVLRADDRHAVVVNHRERRSNGTPVIERRLGVRATSRGIPTLLRLLARHGG